MSHHEPARPCPTAAALARGQGPGAVGPNEVAVTLTRRTVRVWDSDRDRDSRPAAGSRLGHGHSVQRASEVSPAQAVTDSVARSGPGNRRRRNLNRARLLTKACAH